MFPIEDEPLLPSGHLMIHSKHKAAGASVGRKKAAELSKKLNTVEYLTDNLISIEYIYRKSDPLLGLVQTIFPTAPYGYGGVMVLAANPNNWIDRSNGRLEPGKPVPTTNIYDYDFNTQEEYFRQILASLRAIKKVQFLNHELGSRVIVVENTTADVSNEEHRISRSIALPHAQVCLIGERVDVSKSPPRYLHQQIEQGFLQREEMMTRFIKDISSEMREHELGSHLDVRFALRGATPYGYSILTGIKTDICLLKNISIFQKLMNIHHQAYTRVSKEFIAYHNLKRDLRKREWSGERGKAYISKKPLEMLLIPQPSYRTYIYEEGKNLKVTISPEFISGTAVVEAAGIFIERGPCIPAFYSIEQLAEIHNRTASIIREYLL